MGTTCKHGVDERFCAFCQQTSETEPLRHDALQLTSEGKPALLLRIEIGSRIMKALVLDGDEGRLATFNGGALRTPDSTDTLDRQEALDLFRRAALQMGYLFQPEHALTYREHMEEGPPHCYSCHTELSQAKHSLGCTQCHSYVCQCGLCLCGYTGRNYLGQMFSQFPPLPIPRKERLEFVRVVKFCKART
jgi:hypothetical protein